ncbi:MAG: hypothetical protein MUC48_19190 [Leptolyngbya sp. Prado105]|nr:hypothetical protein [Leptolyngbya sp. Prado105]
MSFSMSDTPQIKEALYDRDWVWTSWYFAGERNWSHPNRPNQSYTLEFALKLEGLNDE